LYPEILPGVRSNGRRYPQSILSYRFALSLREPRSAIANRPIASLIPEADLPPPQSVVIDGRGWGHHIGMSQYGARVLAETGYSYDDILAHYYNELRPEVVEGLLPDEVLVGLAWERDRISLVADGPFFIAIDDIPQFVVGGGEWTLVHTEAGTVGVVPPVSYLLDLIAILRTGPRRL